MPLGQAKTRKFNIGTAELRVGPLTSAMRLTQAHSVGLVDKVMVNITQTKVDLEGMFPKVVVDSAITDQKAEITGTLREYSRRNMNIMVGNGLEAAPGADVETTVAAVGTVAAGATALDVASAAGLSAGDFIIVWNDKKPEEVSVVQIDSILVNALTLNANTPTVVDHFDGSHVIAARPVTIGNVTQTNYFAAMILQKQNSNGRPLIFNFWKVTNSAGMDYSSDASNFASTDMKLTCLTPVAVDYAAGQPLEHLADIIPDHPMGMITGGAD